MPDNDSNRAAPRTPSAEPPADDTNSHVRDDSSADPNRTADRPPSVLVTVARTPSDVARLEAAAQATAAEGVPGYAILRELGRGGMGVVYEARHLKLNRVVALKMMLAGGHVSRVEMLRFLAEAEAVAAVRHPNVVQVYDYGESDGRPYMALEYCPGGTLTALLPRKPEQATDPRGMAELLAEVARGVAAAHAAGIVHRDPRSVRRERRRMRGTTGLDRQEATAVHNTIDVVPLPTAETLLRAVEQRPGTAQIALARFQVCELNGAAVFRHLDQLAEVCFPLLRLLGFPLRHFRVVAGLLRDAPLPLLVVAGLLRQLLLAGQLVAGDLGVLLRTFRLAVLAVDGY